MRAGSINALVDGRHPGRDQLHLHAVDGTDLGREIAHFVIGQIVQLGLLETHDIVVEQFRPGVMERLDLGYEALRSRNPRIIYCSINSFGDDGPGALRTAFEPLAQNR